MKGLDEEGEGGRRENGGSFDEGKMWFIRRKGLFVRIVRLLMALGGWKLLATLFWHSVNERVLANRHIY